MSRNGFGILFRTGAVTARGCVSGFYPLLNSLLGGDFGGAVPQAVGGFQHLIALQAVGKFLNIAVPLAARQRVQMRQRGTVLIVSGKIEPAGIDLIRVGRFLAGKLTH